MSALCRIPSSNTSMVKDICAKWSYTYEDAIEKIELYLYDCMVVDINLPDGSGLDLIRLVKRKSISVGIIIISARNSLDNRIEGLEIGADHYLTKPFHMAELNANLKSIHRRISFNGSNELILNEIRLIPDEAQGFCTRSGIGVNQKRV